MLPGGSSWRERMDAANFFSNSASTSSKKRRQTNKSAAGRLINSSTTERPVDDAVPDRSRRASHRTYSPGQGLLDFDLSSDEENDDEGEDREDSLTVFNTPTNNSSASGVQCSQWTSTPLSRVQHNTTRPSSGDMSQLLSMLQQQQATLMQQGEVLQETLRNQRAQSTKLVAFEKKLTSLEDKYDEVMSAQSRGKKKIKVTRDISVSLIHYLLYFNYSLILCVYI